VTVLERGRRRATRPPRARFVRVLLLASALVLAFLLGIAVSRTLDERPAPGPAVTEVRTLTPLPQQPPTRTVTVTVTETAP
jgi:hypothetical protein